MNAFKISVIILVVRVLRAGLGVSWYDHGERLFIQGGGGKLRECMEITKRVFSVDWFQVGFQLYVRWLVLKRYSLPNLSLLGDI